MGTWLCKTSHSFDLVSMTKFDIMEKVRTKFDRGAFSVHAFASIASAFKTYMAQDGGGPPHLLPMKYNWCPEFSVSPILSVAPSPVHVLLGKAH